MKPGGRNAMSYRCCRISKIRHVHVHNDIPVRNCSKLRVIKPSRSWSYRLKTSVIRLSTMQLCTNKSKLMRPCPVLSYVVYIMLTKVGERRYPNATKALLYSSMET